MLANYVGLKYNYNLSDFNKTGTTGNDFSQLSKNAYSTDLQDSQIVMNASTANQNSAQNNKNNTDIFKDAQKRRFEPNNSLLHEETTPYSPKEMQIKENEKKAKNDLQNKLLNIKDDKLTDKTANSSGKNKITEHGENKHDGFDKDCPLCDCETCKNRRYQDGSNDSAVSFQQATKMSPEKAAQMVKSHEMEHVRREQYKAKEENKRIISQSVQIKTSVCEECGDTYVSGGLTRTSTKPYLPEFIDLFKIGAEDITKKGSELDKSA